MESYPLGVGAAHAPGPSGFVSETYKRYKPRTEAFLTWLANAAGHAASKQCRKKKGFDYDQGRFKQFASTHDYILAGEQLKMAKPSLQVPGDIVQHLQDAISLRRDCTAYYEARGIPAFTISKNGGISEDVGSQGHRYVTNILEKLKNILSPARVENSPLGRKSGRRQYEYRPQMQQ